MKGNFLLNNLTVRFLTDDAQIWFSLHTSKLSVDLVQRPYDMEVDIALSKLEMTDHSLVETSPGIKYIFSQIVDTHGSKVPALTGAKDSFGSSIDDESEDSQDDEIQAKDGSCPDGMFKNAEGKCQRSLVSVYVRMMEKTHPDY